VGRQGLTVVKFWPSKHDISFVQSSQPPVSSYLQGFHWWCCYPVRMVTSKSSVSLKSLYRVPSPSTKTGHSSKPQAPIAIFICSSFWGS
jgi:hypothetical protein